MKSLVCLWVNTTLWPLGGWGSGCFQFPWQRAHLLKDFTHSIKGQIAIHTLQSVYNMYTCFVSVSIDISLIYCSYVSKESSLEGTTSILGLKSIGHERTQTDRSHSGFSCSWLWVVLAQMPAGCYFHQAQVHLFCVYPCVVAELVYAKIGADEVVSNAWSFILESILPWNCPSVPRPTLTLTQELCPAFRGWGANEAWTVFNRNPIRGSNGLDRVMVILNESRDLIAPNSTLLFLGSWTNTCQVWS